MMTSLTEPLPSTPRPATTPQMLEAALDATSDYLFIFDPQGNCLFLGKAMAQVFGLDQDWMRGKPLPLRDSCPEFADIIDNQSVDFPAMDSEISGTVKVALSNGEQRFHYTLTPLQDADEQTTATLFRARDITGEQATLSALQEANRHLTQAMSETHHRVKNNLQIVCSLAEMQMADSGESASNSAMQRINQHVRALAAIHDILTYAVSGNQYIEQISTRTLLEQLFPMLQTTLPNRKIHYDIEDVSLPVRESSALALICNELISNAAKHGAGEVTLVFRVEATGAVLEVSDNGAGFPDGFQAETSANTGLDLVQSLARWDLGGNVRFDNCATGGACITIHFPLPQ